NFMRKFISATISLIYGQPGVSSLYQNPGPQAHFFDRPSPVNGGNFFQIRIVDLERSRIMSAEEFAINFRQLPDLTLRIRDQFKVEYLSTLSRTPGTGV